jgi:hypothetical protein
MDNGLALEIEKFVDAVDSTSNPEFVSHMKEALIWLGKRQSYSHEYYKHLKENTSQDKLEAAMFAFDEEVRVKFEAANLAFLQNIHAACDAFPFALHVLLGGLSSANGKNGIEYFKWNKALIDEVAQKFPNAPKFHAALKAFSADVNFLMLTALVNQAKHKFLPRLKSNIEAATNHYSLIIVSFEYFTYPNGKAVPNTKQNLDVLEFARLIHNDTLFKLYALYQLAYKCVSA